MRKVNKTLYAVLTILFGCIGVNKFYAHKIKQGIASLLFCWTGIPFILSIGEFIATLTEKADKNGKIDVESNRRSNVAFGISLFLFTACIILVAIPWESLFKTTIFTKFNEFLNGELVFTRLIGAPVTIEETYGQSTGIIPVIGSWTINDISILLVILSVVIAFASKLKLDEFFENGKEALKKVVPSAAITIVVSLVLVIFVTSSVNVTIVNAILGLTKGSGIVPKLLTGSLATICGGISTSDFYYFVATTGMLFSKAAGKYAAPYAFLLQALFNLLMIVTPTSVGLILGLSYFGIPYGAWLKHIWKIVLVLFLVVLAISIILTLSASLIVLKVILFVLVAIIVIAIAIASRLLF